MIFLLIIVLIIVAVLLFGSMDKRPQKSAKYSTSSDRSATDNIDPTPMDISDEAQQNAPVQNTTFTKAQQNAPAQNAPEQNTRTKKRVRFSSEKMERVYSKTTGDTIRDNAVKV
jgi:FtsZ-interacting cell division protein ZipA